MTSICETSEILVSTRRASIEDKYLGDKLDESMLRDGTPIRVGDFLHIDTTEYKVPDGKWRIVMIRDCYKPNCHVIYLEHRETKQRICFTSDAYARIMSQF